MKRIITTLAALAVSASFSIAADEAKKPEGKDPAKRNPEKIFARKDKDKDGSLTKEEFTANAKDAAKAEAAFAKRDANSDGKISKEEFAAQPAPAKKKKKAE